MILFFILAIAFIFRFYNVQDWLFFGMDQEYEAFLVKNILSGIHFPAIGVNAGDTGLYLGPLFIYFAVIPYALFQGSPVGGAVVASTLGILTTYFIYLLGKLWWDKSIGFIASFLYASSFLATLYDRQFWNPTPIPLATVILLYSLTKVLKDQPKYLILSSVILGFALQSHLQAVILLIIAIGFIVYFHKNIKKSLILIFFIILILFQAPLIFFDLRHEFTNTKALAKLIIPSERKQKIITTNIGERFRLFFNSLGRSIYVKGPIDLYLENGQCEELIPERGKTNIIAIAISVAMILIFIYRTRANLLITYILIATFIGLFIYNHRIYEYYFLYLLPPLYLIYAFVLVSLFKKKKIVFLFLLSLFFLLNANVFFTAGKTYSFQNKLQAIKFASIYIEDENYNLKAFGECGKYQGYRYLFEYFGKIPNASYMDPYFSWIYGEPKKNKVAKEVIVALDGRDYRPFKEKVIAESQFGKILIYITNNEEN